LLADRRRHAATLHDVEGVEPVAPPEPPILELDPELEVALRTLSESDREALLLIAWEDLTPSAAAASLGISAAAFRVRLHRARRRLLYELGTATDRRQPDNCQPSLEQL
jgi:DNA-directed RNA polymerase specialized sigma24 family protein